MSGLILCCMINYESDVVFPSLVKEMIVFFLSFVNHVMQWWCVFHHLFKQQWYFSLVFVAGLLCPSWCKLDHRVCVMKSWQVWDTLVMKSKHVIWKKNVLQVVGVSSLLKAQKYKGKGDGSETFQDACDVDKVHKNCRLFFMLFEYQKLLSGEDWARWLQRHTQDKGKRDTQDKEGLWKLGNKKDYNSLELGQKSRSCCPHYASVNGSSIWARMRESEPVKVWLTFVDGAVLRRQKCGQNSATGFWVNLWPV